MSEIILKNTTSRRDAMPGVRKLDEKNDFAFEENFNE
jgi:hypothetical protein